MLSRSTALLGHQVGNLLSLLWHLLGLVGWFGVVCDVLALVSL